MNDTEFPNEFNLRMRAHALYVHLYATLEFADEISAEGPEALSPDDLKLFDDLAEQLERGWIKAAKIKKRAQGEV